MDRDTFLRRIREQAAIGRNFPVPFNPDATERESYVGGGADLVATFLVEWQGAGGRSYRSPTRAAAQSQISDLLKSMAPTRVLCWRHRLLERLEVARLIQEAGAEVLWWDDLEQRTDSERWELAFSAQFGITSVDWGIAETGSMVMCARPGGQGRAPSLLPPVHLSLLEPAQILPDLFDLYDRLGENLDTLPSNVTLITGPSKTGDIQLQLTTGVHGPGEVHALVCEEP